MDYGIKRKTLETLLSAGLESMELHPSLRDNVRLLGEQLGQIMVSDQGSPFLERIERLRGLSKSVHQGDDGARDLLIQEVRNLGDEE